MKDKYIKEYKVTLTFDRKVNADKQVQECLFDALVDHIGDFCWPHAGVAQLYVTKIAVGKLSKKPLIFSNKGVRP